jgi:hypothetical protein
MGQRFHILDARLSEEEIGLAIGSQNRLGLFELRTVPRVMLAKDIGHNTELVRGLAERTVDVPRVLPEIRFDR